MFPVDWQSGAVRDLVMLAAVEGHRSDPPPPTGRDVARSARPARRSSIGAALVRGGRRLEGGRWLAPGGQTPGPVAASGAGR